VKGLLYVLWVYLRQGGPWMVFLGLCSLCTWVLLTAYVFPLFWPRAKGKNFVIENRRVVSTMAVLAMVSPLLGLLGTVSGMISAFDTLAHSSVVNPKTLASSISEALITTQVGLTIAVPAMLGAHVLSQNRNRRGKNS